MTNIVNNLGVRKGIVELYPIIVSADVSGPAASSDLQQLRAKSAGL